MPEDACEVDERTTHPSPLSVSNHFQSLDEPTTWLAASDGGPLIVHHMVAFGMNSGTLISPYKKFNIWALQRIQAAGNA